MNPQTMLISAHWAMASTLIVSVIIVYIAYGANLKLSIPIQAFLHVGLIILPALFKISYIIRLNALKQLGRPVD